MVKYNYTFADMADILHQAAFVYMASNLSIHFDDGESYTPVEVHMLKYVVDYPGKTVTELSRDWFKTKAAISQMMAKLEKKGLVYKKPAPDSDKKQLYFATEKGLSLNESHINYDSIMFHHLLDLMKETCSDEEIASCFHVLEAYTTTKRKQARRSPRE